MRTPKAVPRRNRVSIGWREYNIPATHTTAWRDMVARIVRNKRPGRARANARGRSISYDIGASEAVSKVLAWNPRTKT
jgi:hypothetical protein